MLCSLGGSMAQHFLLSAAARSLSIGKVRRMSDRGAENVFARLRWPNRRQAGMSRLRMQTCYDCRRGAYPRWRCQACGHDFSVTSGTLFAWHKLPLKTYLLSIVLFCNEVKGKSMLALSRDLGVQYKTAFVLAHKLREAMASSLRGVKIGGEGKTAEIDGAYFGGHVRQENLASDRVDRRRAENQSGKRKVVVVMRERGGCALPQVFASEDEAVSFIRSRIEKGTVVHADESPAWNPLHAKFSMKRVNHQEGSVSLAPAPTARSPTSPACVAANWGIIITSPAFISSDTPRKPPGAKITAASRTANRPTASSNWPWACDPPSISADIGSGRRLPKTPARPQPQPPRRIRSFRSPSSASRARSCRSTRVCGRHPPTFSSPP